MDVDYYSRLYNILKSRHLSSCFQMSPFDRSIATILFRWKEILSDNLFFSPPWYLNLTILQWWKVNSRCMSFVMFFFPSSWKSFVDLSHRCQIRWISLHLSPFPPLIVDVVADFIRPIHLSATTFFSVSRIDFTRVTLRVSLIISSFSFIMNLSVSHLRADRIKICHVSDVSCTRQESKTLYLHCRYFYILILS